MSKESVKMQPWQVFDVAIRYLGADRIARVFNREKRSPYNWAADPLCTMHRCASPLELMHKLFCLMADAGLGYVVRAAIRYLQTAVNDVEGGGSIIEPLPTIEEEILADYSAVGELQRAIEAQADIEDIRLLEAAARAEIERTVARYVKDAGYEAS